MTPAAEPLMSVEEALGRLFEAAGAPLPPEEVPVGQALGRVLASPIVSALDLPPWDNSAMDGYAVHAADTAGASLAAPVRLRVVSEVKAGGSAELAVPPGCAVRIATGAPVPADANAVVPVESTALESSGASAPDHGEAVRAAGFAAGEALGDSCLIVAAAHRGDNVRRRGDDVLAGAELLAPGTPLGAAQIALAAGVGRSSVTVYRRPVVAVLATGDELREAGWELGGSGIPDANRPGLLAACTLAGAEVVDLGIARDTLESVMAALGAAVDRVDAIVVSGGVSVGPYDVVRNAFATLGIVDLWRVAIQPGKPFAFGRAERRDGSGRQVLLFGLPGNPVSTLVTFELFVRPVLERLGGKIRGRSEVGRAVTADTLKASPGRRGFVRVIVRRGADGEPLRDERGRYRVNLAGGQGSHALSVMAVADALAVVPETRGRLDPEDEVEIRWLGR